MPGDVLMIQGLDLRGMGASMYDGFDNFSDYGDLIPSMSGLGALLPSGREVKETAIAGAGLAVGLSGMLLVERFVQRQFNLSAKAVPFVDLIGGVVVGKAIAYWFNPMLGAAVTAAGAALAVMRFFKSWLGYSMGLGALSADMDGFGADEDELGAFGEDYLEGLDQITVTDVGAVVPELA